LSGAAEREAENKWVELYLLTNPLRDETKKETVSTQSYFKKSLFIKTNVNIFAFFVLFCDITSEGKQSIVKKFGFYAGQSIPRV